MSSIIFYGAGQNARENFERWASAGLEPVCFADSDYAKHHTYFTTPNGDKIEILPLMEAINKHSDYMIYCTLIPQHLAELTECLLGFGIPKERIRYCDGFQKSAYCGMLEDNTILIDVNKHGKTMYSYCCAHGSKKRVFNSSGDFSADYQDLLEYIKLLRDLLKGGYYTRCGDCAMLSETYNKNRMLRFIIASGLKGGDLCNFNCCYCTYSHVTQKGSKLTSEFNDKRYDVLEITNYIENNYNSKDVLFNYASGEIGIAKNYNTELLNIWNRNEWTGEIASNASVFLPGIAELLTKKRINLVTALDSGTSDTFAKIKGARLFDKVLENLEKYAKTGGNIYIRYIVLNDINDNEKEIDSFLNIINSLYKINSNIKICVTRNYFNTSLGELMGNELYAFKYLVKNAKSLGLKYFCFTQSFSRDDIKKIETGQGVNIKEAVLCHQ